jgi:hypothetical protein
LSLQNTQYSGGTPFPSCGGDCYNPYTADEAHQPSIAYVPYLITGDHFYLEELQFWANWNFLTLNFLYRNYDKRIFTGQVRGQAWSLRELGRVVYITPDNHPLKQYFLDRLKFNLDAVTQKYANNPNGNKLGAIEGYCSGCSFYEDYFAPWQDDFYTWAVGHLVELGFTEAVPIRNWKTKFGVGRMGVVF